MNKYKTITVVDPMTFSPIIGIFYNEKPFVSINIAMSKDDAKTLPFSNKENFERLILYPLAILGAIFLGILLEFWFF